MQTGVNGVNVTLAGGRMVMVLFDDVPAPQGLLLPYTVTFPVVALDAKSIDTVVSLICVIEAPMPV
jgi:hypothetical protein